MRLGIKIGPQNWGPKLENDLSIRFAEVFFDLERAAAYPPMFAWLREHGIYAGLHASTALPRGVAPNLVIADRAVRRASSDLIRRTIEVAAERDMHYVVFHPGSYQVLQVVRDRSCLIGERTEPHLGNALLRREVLSLAAYARACGVQLLAENLPACDYLTYQPLDRAQVVAPGFVSWTVLRALGQDGVGLCVDVGHLYAEMMAAFPIGNTVPDVQAVKWFSKVMAATRTLVPYARHIHLSTTIPPWNGSDSHNGFLDADYALGALPTREQIADWLRLFDGRDVLAIPEPSGDSGVHLDNYAILKKMMEHIN